MDFNFLLFDDFETLDVFGPVEVFARPEGWIVRFYSMKGGRIRSRQGYFMDTLPILDMAPGGVLVVPGGMGTRPLSKDEAFLEGLRTAAKDSAFLLSVCTGSALYAAAGLLDGRKATSNKRAFDWAMSCSGKVDWQREPRWVADGNIYTSAGVSAGIDMALAFVSDLKGREFAEEIAKGIEYEWRY